QKKDRFLGLF
uniref:Tachykinin-like peptide-VII n=1 Tax=Phoneutria nigriventer TaxID=6918 RepID=TLP7_PHONI|nr:RecName: Full=Tachykinin-like peptide-VII; AltName: Full=P.nigriventer tachykinin peptides VII; Short=PnTkP-VII; AltName: Full=U29-ctenitoxin-Pn1g; Short=U29-CNTX-Pn1g [Phoneutria nigriventer]